MAKRFMILHPYYRMLATNQPGVGSTITLPTQSRLVGSAFLGVV